MRNTKPRKPALCAALCPFIVSAFVFVLILSFSIFGNAAEINAGYTLFGPLESKTVSLMDDAGNIVHSWETDYRPGISMYFLENGLLLHTGNIPNTIFTVQTNTQSGNKRANRSENGAGNAGQASQSVGGSGGIIQLIDWDGNVTWEYVCSDETKLQHHDVEMLPNGNILVIAWEYKTEEEALTAGRDPQLLAGGILWPDSILEIMPTGDDSGEIVWEWHMWDHLIQDYDASKANYGNVSEHPELINLNYTLQNSEDWTHINSVDYNAEFDQILLSAHNFDEIWIIDHSTTTEEAAGHSGGASDCGGDLLFRWGNPQAYDAGDANGQVLFGQHNAEWIEAGLPGEGHILIFNNGAGRTGSSYSSVDEIIPPLNADGSYNVSTSSDILCWRYTADTPTDFFARNISSAQRLPNENTLINSGPNGYFFEVTPDGETVWEYSTNGSFFNIERYASDYPGFAGTSLGE